jgi:hypothetical protein
VSVDFEDAVLRLERAANQTDSLEQDVAAFLDANPGGFALNQNRETGVFTISLVVNKQPPREWRVVLQEIIGNMRSPFDYVAVAIADAHGGHNNRTSFPIYAKEKAYRKGVAGKTVNLPEQAVAMIEAVQPYHGGDYVRLDVLRRLDDDGKHKRLHVATSGVVETGLGINYLKGHSLHVTGVYSGALNHGDPLITFTLDGEAEIHPQFTPEVVMGKGTAAEGRPVVVTLREIHETSAVVIDQFVQAFG